MIKQITGACLRFWKRIKIYMKAAKALYIPFTQYKQCFTSLVIKLYHFNIKAIRPGDQVIQTSNQHNIVASLNQPGVCVGGKLFCILLAWVCCCPWKSRLPVSQYPAQPDFRLTNYMGSLFSGDIYTEFASSDGQLTFFLHNWWCTRDYR